MAFWQLVYQTNALAEATAPQELSSGFCEAEGLAEFSYGGNSKHLIFHPDESETESFRKIQKFSDTTKYSL